MYKKIPQHKTTLEVNESTEGETIEQKMERVVNNGEPITDGAPIMYTERNEGVKAEYDIRTDRFEIAVDAMDKVQKTHLARREERHNPKQDSHNEEAKNPGTGDNSGTSKVTE